MESEIFAPFLEDHTLFDVVLIILQKHNDFSLVLMHYKNDS